MGYDNRAARGSLEIRYGENNREPRIILLRPHLFKLSLLFVPIFFAASKIL